MNKKIALWYYAKNHKIMNEYILKMDIAIHRGWISDYLAIPDLPSYLEEACMCIYLNNLYVMAE